MLNALKFVFAIVLVAQASTCKKEDLNISAPECILQKIAAIKAEEVWNPPAKVFEYDYNGQKVYYIPARCCDIPSSLYDSNCKLICNPDGGFTGKGDGKCTDFAQKRTNEKLIWQDDRK